MCTPRSCVHSASERGTELSASSLERKVRLLTLSELGFAKIGQNVSYADIASALHIQDSEVEKWVIDGMCYVHPFRYRLITQDFELTM